MKSYNDVMTISCYPKEVCDLADAQDELIGEVNEEVVNEEVLLSGLCLNNYTQVLTHIFCRYDIGGPQPRAP